MPFFNIPGDNAAISVIPPYASPQSGAIAGLGSQSRFIQDHLAPSFWGLLAFALVLFSGCWISQGAESSTPAADISQIEETNSQQLLRTCLQIQEQLQATHLAIERNRQEAKEAAAQNAEGVSKGLQVLKEAFSAERAREFEVLQSSNRAIQRSYKVTLIVASTFAALGSLIMLLMAYFQWRTSISLAAISTVLPTSRGLGPATNVTALGLGNERATPSGQTEQSSLRLLGAIEQLDKRIDGFKGFISSGGNGDVTVTGNHGSASTGFQPSQVNEHDRILALLNKAHSLMALDNAEAALSCYDEVLSLDPNYTEALVKKGAALERLKKLDEAFECYDRAIAADNSMAIAYLHKGGLCSRLERFKEALECYEKALRTHTEWGGSS